MKRCYFVLLGVSLWMLFTASTCERTLEIEIDEPVRLVAIGEFSPNGPFQIAVSQSRSLFEQESFNTIYRRDAKVELWQSGNAIEQLEFVGQLTSAIPFYQSKKYPETEVIYDLTIEVPGYPVLSSSGYIPKQIYWTDVRIDRFDIETIEDSELPEQLAYNIDLSLIWSDPEGEKNYYQINVYKPITFFYLEGIDTVKNDFEPAHPEMLDIGVDLAEGFVVNHNGGILIEDESVNGQEIVVPLSFEFFLNPSTEILEKMYVELRHVSEDYYQFHRSLTVQQEQVINNTPLTEPVVVHSNIDQGIGIFAGYNSHQDTIILK